MKEHVVPVGMPRHQRDEWPNARWARQLRRNPGWRPTPFHDFVLKIHERCNLSCDYCYMYEAADQSWRDRPFTMSVDTVAHAARRIREHAIAHELREADVILHGGEPLLVGPTAIGDIATTIREAMPARTRLRLTVQTNAVLLDVPMLDVLRKHGIRVGVSVDGDRDAHDRHRRFANGQGSHDAVMRGLRLLTQDTYRELFAGLLATVDVSTDPIAVYDALLEFDPPSVDFLLPHGNWDAPPPRRVADAGSTPYADWLIPAFERWYAAPHLETRVRLFEAIMVLVLGGRSSSEAVGLSPSAVVVVETDGTIEQADQLKTAYPGAPWTGLTVVDHSFDEALEHPAIMARQAGVAALSKTCKRCWLRDICGGGHYVDRYRRGSGFRNPSVFCPDLMKLIGHIGTRVSADLRALGHHTEGNHEA